MNNALKIYVASSWRNELQPVIVKNLRLLGHDVYDFRNPAPGDSGFNWSDVDPKWQTWTREQYIKCLTNPIVEAGFRSDLVAMKRSDIFIGVMPFGRSASFEMGWAAGQGKKTILLLEENERPELMVKLFDHVVCSLEEIAEILMVS